MKGRPASASEPVSAVDGLRHQAERQESAQARRQVMSMIMVSSIGTPHCANRVIPELFCITMSNDDI
jgi:hypothetical protein